MKTKLPDIVRKYPNDMNMLSFLFQAARNDRILNMLLTEIQFIRDHPMLTEEQARRQLELQNMPVKVPEKLPKRP